MIFLAVIILFGALLSWSSYDALQNEDDCKDKSTKSAPVKDQNTHIRTYWLILSVIGACMMSLALTSWVSCPRVDNSTNTLPYINIFLGLNIMLMFFSSLLVSQYNSSNSKGCSSTGKKTAVWFVVASVIGLVVSGLLKARKLRLNSSPMVAPSVQLSAPVVAPVAVQAPPAVPGPPLPPRPMTDAEAKAFEQSLGL